MNSKDKETTPYHMFESHRPWINGLINYSMTANASDSTKSAEVSNEAIIKMMGK